MRSPLTLALGLAVALGTSAVAAPRTLVVDTVRGDTGALRQQLEHALCGQVPCAPRSRVTTHGRLDARKMERIGALVLTGRQSGRHTRSVTLRLEDSPGHVLGRYAFPVGRRGLSGEALDTLLRAVQDALGVSPPAKAPLRPNPLPTVPGPKVAPAPQPSPPPTQATPPGMPAQPSAVSGPVVAAKKRKTPLPLVAVEAGVSGVNISHGYQNLATGNLRAYDASFALVPRLRLETYPLARITDGWPRGIGAELEYQAAVGLHSSIEGGPDHGTTYHALDLILKYRWEPFDVPLRVEPLVGLRFATFRVEPLNGVFISGLPTLDYDGPQLGIAADYPVGRFLVLARARFLPLLASGEVLSTDYFDQGSLWGVDLEAGVGFQLWRALSLRAEGEYTRYHFTFRTQPGDMFQASGATSRYVGGRVMVRYDFE